MVCRWRNSRSEWISTPRSRSSEWEAEPGGVVGVRSGWLCEVSSARLFLCLQISSPIQSPFSLGTSNCEGLRFEERKEKIIFFFFFFWMRSNWNFFFLSSSFSFDGFHQYILDLLWIQCGKTVWLRFFIWIMVKRKIFFFFLSLYFSKLTFILSSFSFSSNNIILFTLDDDTSFVSLIDRCEPDLFLFSSLLILFCISQNNHNNKIITIFSLSSLCQFHCGFEFSHAQFEQRYCETGKTKKEWRKSEKRVKLISNILSSIFSFFLFLELDWLINWLTTFSFKWTKDITRKVFHFISFGRTKIDWF